MSGPAGKDAVGNKKILHPELFFCLVGPVGVDLETVSKNIKSTLSLYEYETKDVHITDLLPVIDPTLKEPFSSLDERYNKLIDRSNELRKEFKSNAILAEIALLLIQKKRAEVTQNPNKAAHKTAYIIRQFKRTEEIALFREIYGKQVFQVSVYMDAHARRKRLAVKMRDHDTASTRTSDFESAALSLINRDENESANDYGQRVRDVFPLADVFIDASTSDTVKQTVERFLKIVYGYNFHSPSRDEHGMYVAKSASLRSVDLSRQVGAAIFSRRGEIKVLGCNEVPSPQGGTYWEDDAGDAREFKIGWDTNDSFKLRLLSDTLKQLATVGVVPSEFAEMKPQDFIEKIKETKGINLDKRLMMMDVIEYGRIIHAEMNAITDAARKGISVEDSVLYCTTFPCHLCAKHIISSGIKRVVYIEPYPKSYATELYRDDINLERSSKDSLPGKVYFEPFIGIAPFRYRDFFEKSKRKNSDGTTKDWSQGKPTPDLNIRHEEYLKVEDDYLKILVNRFREKKILLPDSYIIGGKSDSQPKASPQSDGSEIQLAEPAEGAAVITQSNEPSP